MQFWNKSGSLAKHGRLGESKQEYVWEPAQLNIRFLFLFLRNGTSDWPGLAKGGRTVCLWMFLLFLREWYLTENFVIILTLYTFQINSSFPFCKSLALGITVVFSSGQ